jgi:hypothetical protein
VKKKPVEPVSMDKVNAAIRRVGSQYSPVVMHNGKVIELKSRFSDYQIASGRLFDLFPNAHRIPYKLFVKITKN